MNTGERWACVARFGGFGDNLIATSVLPGLRKQYGRVEVIAAKPMHVMYENNPHIDKLSVREQGSPPWGDGHSWQQWFRDRSEEYAFFANLSHSCETLGALQRVQTAYWWPAAVRRKLCNHNYLELVHDICGVPHSEIAPDFFPTAEERAQALETKARVGQRVVGWLMAGSRLDKRHPHLDLMVAKVLKQLGVPVIVFGAGARDLDFGKELEREVRKLNGSLDGLHLAMSHDPEKPSWGPRRLATQVQHCDLVVGPDTGPMWAVAMHAMPKLLMLSHASPENITKHWKNTTTLHADQGRVPCWPCHRLHDGPDTCVPNADKNGPACLTDISVEMIVEQVKKLLEANDGSDLSVRGEGDAGLGAGRRGADAAERVGGGTVTRFPDQHQR